MPYNVGTVRTETNLLLLPASTIEAYSFLGLVLCYGYSIYSPILIIQARSVQGS